MLTHMPDTQKFTVTQKLCQDVLLAAVERDLPLNSAAATNILVDALTILQGKVNSDNVNP